MEPLKRLGSYNAGMTRQRRRWKGREQDQYPVPETLFGFSAPELPG